ncbi:MAG: hypothetical protein AAFR16_03955 [Pseudomonadota bacterium]
MPKGETIEQLVLNSSVVACAALISIASSEPAVAQTSNGVVCGDRDIMVAHLDRHYGEVRRGAGLQSANGVMELFVSETGSWTLLLTRPNGRSCPVAAGEAWQQEEGVAIASEGEPA